MMLEVLIDGQSRGSLELSGHNLMLYGHVVNQLNELICGLYGELNPDSPDYLEVSSNIRLKAVRAKRGRS